MSHFYDTRSLTRLALSGKIKTQGTTEKAHKEAKMKVKYLGYGQSEFEIGRIYDVLTIEDGWYRIMNENHDEELFPPKAFEIIDGAESNVVLVIA